MISIDYVNIQLEDYFSDYQVCQYGDILTSNIEIQFDLTTFKKNALYLNVKSPTKKDLPYIKVDFDGRIIEIYPSFNDRWSIEDTVNVNNGQMHIQPYEYPTDHIPYASYNIERKELDNAYMVLNFNAIKSKCPCISIARYDKDFERDRLCFRINSSNFDKLDHLLEPKEIDLVKEGQPDSIVLYQDTWIIDVPHVVEGQKRFQKILMSWSALNKKHKDLKNKYLVN